MSDHNLWACLDLGDGDRIPALCGHEGCRWECTADSDHARREAYADHHTNRHQEG